MNLKILVINGPNLNRLGTREPEIYGNYSLKDLNSDIMAFGNQNNMGITCFQSNSEEKIVNFLHNNGKNNDWLIINPAAFTHTSIAIRDAILSMEIKTIEVHISNIFKREAFRHISYISDIAEGLISGLGVQGYFLALEYIKRSQHEN